MIVLPAPVARFAGRADYNPTTGLGQSRAAECEATLRAAASIG